MITLTQKPLFKGLLLATSILLATLHASPSLAYSPELENGEAVFAVLASEIALQRGEAGIAYKTYLDLARQLNDPRLARRAMEIAITAGSPELALQAAQTWDSMASPLDPEPKEVLVTLLILNQRWPDAVAPATTLLKHETPAQREKTLLQLQALIDKSPNQSEALRAYYEIVATVKPEPTNPDILYTYAMSAEESGHLEVMERILRQILRQHPNDANTLNALGYSLADRNQNLPEAFKLISKAHHLMPQDPFILDSLGWVNFRLGNNELALTQLQQAFTLKPEADIAAHLGEVLWNMHRPIEAEDIWRQGQKLDANNPTLKETLQRLKPNWSVSESPSTGSWDGRFAVKITGLTEGKNQGGSGGFTLTKDALKDTLEIRNPVGGSIAKITITPSEASLERNGEITTAIDADTLLQNTLCLPLPARGLSDWLRGQARPGSTASIERNAQGQVSKILQDGWSLTYNWDSTNRLERLIMTRNSNVGTIDIRLVFDATDD